MNSENAAEVRLPGGLWVKGIRHQMALLRPINGYDEAFLLDFDRQAPPAVRTTAILVRCLTRLGPFSPVEPEIARNLIVGDREALLLHLRRLTLGNKLQCILNCTNPACREKMDLDLNMSDLLVSSYEAEGPIQEITLDYDGVASLIRFRLPTGGDQEDLVDLATTDQEAAAYQLILRCFLGIRDGSRNDMLPDKIPKGLLDQLSAAMAKMDPQAEITLEISCPFCGAVFSALFDAASFVLGEMTELSKKLYEEVHRIALNYHWSEADILSLTTRKRRMYLDLIEEEISGAVR